MPARRASSTLVMRPSACSSARIRRSMASRTGNSAFCFTARAPGRKGARGLRGWDRETIFHDTRTANPRSSASLLAATARRYGRATERLDSAMPDTHYPRVLIIGAGPAGYTAAIYAARASMAPVLVTGLQPGGQLMITTDVENYPGFADVIQGPWLMEQMARQASYVGTRIIHDLITEADLSASPFRCRS